MFRKPKKTIQRRVFSAVEDEEESDNKEFSENVSTSEPPTDSIGDSTECQFEKSKKKKHKSKDKVKDTGRTLLSFDDDGEDNEEVFKVKKSSHSKKVMRQLDRERKRKKKHVIPEEPTGDQVDVQQDGRIKIQTDDLEIILKQTEIKNPNSNDEISDKEYLSGDEEFNEPRHLFSHPSTVKDALERGKIPDAAMIHAARKRRQEAREFGDFVPITTKSNKSRLVREDGDGDGSDEDEDRVDMSVNVQNKDRAERSEKFYEAQDMLYSKESDPELDEWENQQIRKGVTGTQIANAQQETYQFYLQAPAEEDCGLKTSQLRQAYASAGIAPITESKLPSCEERTLQEIENNLLNRIKQVREAHAAHAQDLTRLSEDIMNLKIEGKVAEKKMPEYKRRFKFYQEMRAYIGDLVECLDEKLPCIVSCEQRYSKYQQNEMMFLVERRRQDVSDQVSADKVRNNSDEKFMQRCAEREGRRARRRRAREKCGIQQSHVEGMSSDDEIPDQRELENRQQLEIILSDVSQIFADACKEFASLKSVLECFEEWLREDPETYEDSYVTLCIPKVISPYIRLELVGWNPLKNTHDIEKMEWYNILALFGSQSENSEVEHNDLNMLIPMVVVKIILPKLVDIIELWDPLSSSQTLKVVSLMTKLCKDYPNLTPSCKALNRVFEVIIERIKWAIDHDVYIPLVPKQNEFSQRQFASGVKLLHNILSFQGVIVDSKLMNLAFDLLLNRYLIPIIRICKAADAAEKLKCVTNTLPRIWLQRTGLAQFEPIKQCATNVAQQLSKSETQAVETINHIMKTLNV